MARGKTFYFSEYQGFRQVLGTTQVFPVPTLAERQGIDNATFPGDTLTVPVNGSIAPLLARYPLPNDPHGAYGARTFATSSKVVTRTDQASLRLDHRFSDKAALFLRFSRNQVTGPITNPDQTAIDPDFGVKFFDHQRNAAVNIRAPSRQTSAVKRLSVTSAARLFSSPATTRSLPLPSATVSFKVSMRPTDPSSVPTATSTSSNMTWATRAARIPSNGAQNCDSTAIRQFLERIPTDSTPSEEAPPILPS